MNSLCPMKVDPVPQLDEYSSVIGKSSCTEIMFDLITQDSVGRAFPGIMMQIHLRNINTDRTNY
jgi:hypothetical protein